MEQQFLSTESARCGPVIIKTCNNLQDLCHLSQSDCVQWEVDISLHHYLFIQHLSCGPESIPLSTEESWSYLLTWRPVQFRNKQFFCEHLDFLQKLKYSTILGNYLRLRSRLQVLQVEDVLYTVHLVSRIHALLDVDLLLRLIASPDPEM